MTMQPEQPTAPPASTLISTDDIKAHVESGLDDAGLERIIRQCDALIVGRHGAHAGPLTETLYAAGDGELASAFQASYARVRVSRPIASITSVSVYPTLEFNPEPAALAAADYYQEGRNAIRIRRRWPLRAQVVYEPVDNTSSRQRALIALVKAELRWEPVLAESLDGTASYRLYGLEQRAILDTIREGMV